MGGVIPEETIAAVRGCVDIVQIIAEHLPLKPSGSGFKGLCPFHDEKTPSFHVSPERQTFRCFGCGEAGSVFNFLMKMEGYSFPESVEHLAQRGGIEVIRSQGQRGGPQADRREMAIKALAWGQDFFQEQLQTENSVLSYLSQRGIKAQSVRDFKLGYAPGRSELFWHSSRQSKIGQQALDDAGLIKKDYPFFRNRLIFPIHDPRGQAIGFGARALADQDQPKYLNTAATMVFDKSQALYGLSQARKTLAATRTALLVEGYTDVIMCHQEGFKAALATLGTALTQQNARFLKRYVDEVILLFDGDAAGQKAADQGLDRLLAVDLNVEVVTLPGGNDPCDYLLTHGKAAFQARLDQAEDLVSFRLKQAKDQGLLDKPEQTARVVQHILKTVSHMPSAVKRDLMLQKISLLTGISRQALESDLGPEQAQTANQERQVKAKTVTPALSDRNIQAQHELLNVFMSNPGMIDPIMDALPQQGKVFHEPQSQQLFDLIEHRRLMGAEVSNQALLNATDKLEWQRWLATMTIPRQDDVERIAHECVRIFWDDYAKHLKHKASSQENNDNQKLWEQVLKAQQKSKEAYKRGIYQSQKSLGEERV